MNNPKVLTDASIASYYDCPRQFALRDIQGKEPTPKPLDSAIRYAVRCVLAGYPLNGLQLRRLAGEFQLEEGELFTLIGATDQAAVWWANQTDEFRAGVIATGKGTPLKFELYPGAFYATCLDAVYRTGLEPDAAHWPIIIRVHGSLDDIEERYALDQGGPMLLWCLQQRPADDTPDYQGVIYLTIRRKEPSRPHILQSGKVSSSKAIDTTPEVFAATVRANDQDPADYADVLDHLRENGKPFVSTVWRMVWQKEIKSAGERARIAAQMGLDQRVGLESPRIGMWRKCAAGPVRETCAKLERGELNDRERMGLPPQVDFKLGKFVKKAK